MKSVKVLLADDHALVVEGLKGLVQEHFTLVGTVYDGRALLQAAQRLRPDLIVTDISMPRLNGIDAIHQLKKVAPKCRVVVLTMHSDPYLAQEAFKAGATGYLLKNSAGDELKTCITQVMQGRVYVTPLIAKGVLSGMIHPETSRTNHLAPLTPRQREVLQLVAEGRTLKEIAALLNVSARTAEFHKYSIMQQLNLRSTAELVQHAIRIGLVSVQTS